MSQCKLCKSTGKERKYFFKGKALCDSHYIDYLVFLIDDMNEEVTTSSANSALDKLKKSIEPMPAFKPTIGSKEKSIYEPRSCATEEEEEYFYRMGL